MKEHPIVFSTEMVLAILEDRKTQTRRVIKPQPEIVADWFAWKGSLRCPEKDRERLQQFTQFCPYGQVGDRLWVRETWCPVDDSEFGGEKWIDYRATPRYNAEAPAGWDNVPSEDRELHWKPSIFMPKWAARIWLEITKVRVERLQEITSNDCQAEGLPHPPPQGDTTRYIKAYINSFRQLWDSLNTKRGFSWEVNPFVWVLGFKERG